MDVSWIDTSSIDYLSIKEREREDDSQGCNDWTEGYVEIPIYIYLCIYLYIHYIDIIWPNILCYRAQRIDQHAQAHLNRELFQQARAGAIKFVKCGNCNARMPKWDRNNHIQVGQEMVKIENTKKEELLTTHAYAYIHIYIIVSYYKLRLQS